MDPRQIANLYYDAWRTRSGAMAREAGAAVRDFRVRHQFTDGSLVCSIVDWEMAPLPGTLTAAEVLHVHDGTITRGELIYDAEDLRKAMTAGAGGVVELLERSVRGTEALLSAVTPAGFAAASPCAGWTV